jgi:hypothetical protein
MGAGRHVLADASPPSGLGVTATAACSYVVPVRWSDGELRGDLAGYLAAIRPHCHEIIVVDGSKEPVFEANAAAWEACATHLRPDPGEHCLNGKVAGVRTGIRHASSERIVIADDDVRYDPDSLRRPSGCSAPMTSFVRRTSSIRFPGTRAGIRPAPSSTAVLVATSPEPWPSAGRGWWTGVITTATCCSRIWS